MTAMLSNCRVVLVGPKIPENLGATARIMRNFGLTKLVLVAPEANPADRKARQLSTHGEAILDRAQVVGDWESAVSDCRFVVGTSARIGGPFRRQSIGPAEEIMPHLAQALHDGPAAVVFGPEPSGLTNLQVTRCHFIAHVPTDPGYRALNLAQAVAICLYELRRAWLQQENLQPSPVAPAPLANLERMFADLRGALEAIHFLYGPSADSLLHALRHLIGRARPTSMEVKLLLGLARQIRWFAAHRGEQPTPIEQEPGSGSSG
jgi:tRNA/rRNA methyltransferase